MSGTWGAPNLPSGRDDFKAMLQPRPRPVDDLSRFVLDAISRTEDDPKHDVPQNYHLDAGPIAHRYAKAMRDDMVAFRVIVAQYVEYFESDSPHDQVLLGGFTPAVKAIAMRFADHPGFRDEWRLA